MWFSQLPGRPEEGALLKVLQSSAGTPSLLSDIEVEQAQIARALEQHNLRLKTERHRAEDLARVEARERAEVEQRLAEVAREVARDDAAAAARAKDEKDKKLNDALGAVSMVVGGFFIVDVVLAFTQVLQGGGWGDVGRASIVALPLVVVFMLGLMALYQRLKPGSESRDDASKGPGGATEGDTAGLSEKTRA